VISWPAVVGAHASLPGVSLVLLATLCYGFAGNMASPLQVRLGSLPVIFRAAVVALIASMPLGLSSIPASTFAWRSLIAVATLGIVGTAIAFAGFTQLLGRVGAARGSVTIYFLPLVAMLLGSLVRRETISAVSVAGTGLVLLGAYMASRAERPRLVGRAARQAA
jgi:drug/metabolite transporter (DMT)-like permease